MSSSPDGILARHRYFGFRARARRRNNSVSEAHVSSVGNLCRTNPNSKSCPHHQMEFWRDTGILDFERGREDAITPYPWLDDTATGPWFYVAAEKIKTPEYVVGILADIVAKNGCMLLDVGPKVDGTFPDQSVTLLLEVGRSEEHTSELQSR